MPTAKADLPPETYYQGIDTGVNGDDVGSAALPIGFNFTFFGNTYSDFYVSSNGYVSFNNNDLTDYTNDDIAHNRNPDNYIAPFWDDTTTYNSQDQFIYYQTIGTAPNRKLIIQFTNVGFWNDPTPLGTFFVILYEGSNNIQLQYRYLVGDNIRAHGSSATVGIENANGSAGVKYSYNTESLSSEQVILFTPNGSTYDVSTAPYEGVLLGAGASPAPDIPVQTTPLNGSTVSLTPTFSWAAAANATSYELRIDNNSNMGSLELNPTGLTGTSYTPPAPLDIDTYYWIVIAHNADDSTWSEQWVFTTSDTPPPPPPGVPLLTSPVQDETNVTLSPIFSWQTALNADEYQLIVSEQSDLSSPVINQTGIISPTTSYNASGLNTDTLYYWAIIASNVTTSTQSSTRNFTTLHINTLPTANDDSDSVVEDSGTTQIDVLANDSDPDSGDTLSITAVGATDNGGTAIHNAGQIDYTPALNFVGTEVFTYTISDGNGGSDTATVTITVTDSPVNDAPTANDDSASVVEDSGTTQIDVLANDTDPDSGDTLSIAAVGATDNGGTAVHNAGQIDYTPALNFVGTEVFTYTISDGNGGSDTATVIVNVGGSNDTPEAQDDAPVTNEDTMVMIDVLSNDTDPDGDSLSVTNVSDAAHGTAVSNGNQIQYTPDPNYYGTDIFTYTVTDGEFSDVATVTVTIISVNDAPEANDDAATTTAGTEITIEVLNNDDDPVEGSGLTLVSVSNPANGTATISGTEILYIPDDGFTGTDQFSYTISDGTTTTTAVITVTVNYALIFLPFVINN
ncbi:Ig-like domain-containing protein [Candidatus Leptofilum sp.]|uniref:Ig-like domain-containing protein n=1 Tax=Candidatus Leptofilum sp. TaxID=3241576 RepID=UPI003B5960A6